MCQNENAQETHEFKQNNVFGITEKHITKWVFVGRETKVAKQARESATKVEPTKIF